MSIDAFLQTHRVPRLSSEERSALEGAIARTVRYDARAVIVRENVPLRQCTLLLKGFIHRYKMTTDGKRQILAFHIPGDFVDLHSYPLKHLEHSVAASTAVEVAVFPHAAVRELTAQSTRITEVLWRSTLVDAAINREWMVSIGARGAAARVAHLFCELQLRLDRIGGSDRDGFDLPMTQADLADALGLTPVHTNRMLRELREQGLAEFRDHHVTIGDFGRLREFADFDPGYLFFD
ncbi:Crp/Fnr family transcriptional regulator [Stakelama saccharophila]|uniref:Crp/Fnr family transcriptional regulator n=1 Tax=Stakelama saccharophila TaxID=3075605 RepID=A0ABZ0B896_9SPHN|nr:Crp/Fnr family transcriptional regulator [Stakelama sp. W311]WNO53245.1 Crp/Fnr family transcriptional regulator [Stakelama sp. W311]